MPPTTKADKSNESDKPHTLVPNAPGYRSNQSIYNHFIATFVQAYNIGIDQVFLWVMCGFTMIWLNTPEGAAILAAGAPADYENVTGSTETATAVYFNQAATPEHQNMPDHQLRSSDVSDVTRSSTYEIPSSEYERFQTTSTDRVADLDIYERIRNESAQS